MSFEEVKCMHSFVFEVSLKSATEEFRSSFQLSSLQVEIVDVGTDFGRR